MCRMMRLIHCIFPQQAYWLFMTDQHQFTTMLCVCANFRFVLLFSFCQSQMNTNKLVLLHPLYRQIYEHICIIWLEQKAQNANRIEFSLFYFCLLLCVCTLNADKSLSFWLEIQRTLTISKLLRFNSFDVRAPTRTFWKWKRCDVSVVFLGFLVFFLCRRSVVPRIEHTLLVQLRILWHRVYQTNLRSSCLCD